MKTVSFYHAATGLFHPASLTVSDETVIALNTPPDHAVMEGAHDHLSRRVDVATGEVVDYQPPTPSADHAWDANLKRWVLDPVAQERAARRQGLQGMIQHLERNVQPRALRELALGQDGARERVQKLEDEIAALRRDLTAS
jgi:hypothetical protein